MADNNVKKINQIAKNLENLTKHLRDTDNTQKRTFNNIDSNAKKASKTTKELTKNFENFDKVLSGITSQEFTKSLKDMPNYIKGVSKLTSSYTKYTREVGRTNEMFKTLGISFNKTMHDLEGKSKNVANAMSDLMNRANKFANIKDNISGIPKKLKEIQDAMGDSPEIKVGSIEKLNSLVDNLEGKVSKVDFDDIKKSLSKIGKGEEISDVTKEIQDKLNNVKIEPLIIGGEETGKQLVNEISTELNKMGNLAPGDSLIDTFRESIKELSKDDSFKQVVENNKEAIDEFEKILKKPGVTYTEVSDKMMQINSALKESMNGFFENFRKDAANLENDQNLIIKKQEELSDKFKKGYQLTFLTEEAISQFQGVMAQLSADTLDLQANNIIPDEQLLKTGEMEKALKKLVQLNEENKEIQQDLSVPEEKRKKTIEQIKQAEQKNISAIKDQIRYMKDLEKSSEGYAKNLIAGAEKGFGEDKAEGFSNELFKINGYLQKTGNSLGENSLIGKGLKSLGGLAGSFGGKLKQLAFPVGLITGAISLTKFLLKVESQYAKMSQEIVGTGALMTTSAKDMGSALDSLNIKASNMEGLLAAAMGSKDLALARGEILDVVNTLNSAGIPAKKLKEQMKGVATTAAEAKNEFLGAAAQVTTFSYNLGISKGQVAGMIGEMGHEFGSTMGSVKDTFANITASAQASDMSTNRFLATVQTTTAGMSFYEEQVSDVAKIMGHLSKTTNMSGTDLEKFGKAMGGMSESTDQAMKGLAMMQAMGGKASLSGLADKVTKSMAGLDEKIAKARSRGDTDTVKTLEAQKRNSEELRSALQSGDLPKAAYMMKMASGDVKKALTAGQLEFVAKASGGDRMVGEKLAGSFGNELKDFYNTMQAKGITVSQLQTDPEIVGKFDEQRDAAKEADKKAGDVRNKTLVAAQETATILGGKILPLLYGMTAMMAAGGGLSGLIKLFKGGGLFGKGGVGGGLLDKLSGMGKMGAGTAIRQGAGGMLRGIGGMAKGARGLLNTAGGGVAAFGLLTSSLENVWTMISDGPEKFEKDLKDKYDARSFAEKLMHPIDTLTTLGHKVGDWMLDTFNLGGMDKDVKEGFDKKDKELKDKKAKMLADANLARKEQGLEEFGSYEAWKTHKRANKIIPPATDLNPAIDITRLGRNPEKNISLARPSISNNKSITSNSDNKVVNNITINGVDTEKAMKYVDHKINRTDIQVNK